jgi:hypothetical protein
MVGPSALINIFVILLLPSLIIGLLVFTLGRTVKLKKDSVNSLQCRIGLTILLIYLIEMQQKCSINSHEAIRLYYLIKI